MADKRTYTEYFRDELIMKGMVPSRALMIAEVAEHASLQAMEALDRITQSVPDDHDKATCLIVALAMTEARVQSGKRFLEGALGTFRGAQ